MKKLGSDARSTSRFQRLDRDPRRTVATRRLGHQRLSPTLAEALECRVLLSVVASPGATPMRAATSPADPSGAQQAVWINPAGGDWSVATNWQGGVVPGPDDDVTINEPNNPTITFSNGSATVASITSSDPIALTGGSLTVNGIMDVAAGVALEGGTLVNAKVAADTQLTTPVTSVVSTLDGIEVDGDLTVAANSTNGTRPYVCVVDGLLLNGTMQIGNGNSTGATVEFGNATSAPGSLLGNGQVILDSGGFGNFSSSAGSGTLTIGPNVVVGGSGGIDNYPNAGGGIVNQGTVVSQGITIGNGQATSLPIGFINDGTLEAAVGGALTIAGDYTTADLGTFGGSGTIYLEGTLDNSGATLQLGSTTVRDWATIEAGTVTGVTGATLVGTAGPGTLDGVTLEGNITLVGAFQILDGLTVNGTVNLGQSNGSTSATMSFGDGYGHSSGSLTGTGDLIFGPGKSNYISNDAQIVGNSATNTTLTIGPNIEIDGADGSVVNSPSDTIINQGLIEADVAGGVITVSNYNGGVTSTGTFGAANGGDLVVDGNYTTATFGSIAQSTGGVVQVMGTLDNTGATLNLNASTGSLTINGTLKGGTVNESGGALLVPTTTTILDGLTINGDLNASLSSVDITVLDGLTLNGTLEAGSQSGGNVATIYFGQSGVSPFGLGGNATVVFGINANTITNSSTLSGTAGILTIGPNVLVRGQNGSIINANSSGSLLIQGSVSADTSGGTILVNNGNGTLTNSGTMQAINGGSLTVTNLADANGLSVTGGGTLSLLGSWANSGTITMNNSVLELGGAFTTAGMGTINRTGGSVWLEGTLINTNSTFSLDAATGSWTFYQNAAIDGGTVSFSDGAMLIAQGGTFSGVTLASDMTVSEGTLQITNGMTLDGTLLVAAPGGTSSLVFIGTQTITAGTSNAAIVLQDPGSTANLTSQTTAMTLTLGPGLTLEGQGTITTTGKYATTLANQGTIDADVPGQVLSLAPTTLTNGATGQMIAAGGWLKLGGAWSNNTGGTLAVTGGTLELAGTFTTAGIGTFNWTGGVVNLSGALNNAGSTLALNATTGSWNLTGGTISGGTITESDGAELDIVSGRLTGVTLASSLAVDEGDTLYISSGLTLSGGALITLGNATDNTVGQLIFDGNSQTLAGTGTLVFAGSGNNSIYVQNLANNGLASTNLTIAPGVTIHGQNGTFSAKSTLDTVYNEGTIDSDGIGGTIAFSGIGPLTNAGTLEATAGTLVIDPALFESAGSTFYESPSASVSLGGSLTASNTDAASFQPLGSTTLNGAGTTFAPQLLEVMSQDIGSTAAGFNNNFAYASLSLAAGDDVKLTDQSKNSGGSGPEALYVSSLVVPVGATLNLNGFDLYTMNSTIGGRITGERTSIVAAGSNPAMPSQPLTFTVTINGGVPNGETVNLLDASNQNAVVATGTLSGGSATLSVPPGALGVGTHTLIAAYGGDANFGPSESAPYTQAVLGVNSISPASGQAAGGTTVIITGGGFTGATAVDFGSTPATSFTVNSTGTQITAVDPAGTSGTTVNVTVVTPSGTTATSAADHFTYLPSWLAAGSVASWNASTDTLTVTGSATIIADPGSDEPSILASGSSAMVTVDPATSPADIHIGGVTLTDGATIVMSDVDATQVASGTNAANHHTDHNVLVIGTLGAVNDPTISIGSSSKLDLGDNDLIVHTGSSDTGTTDVQGNIETNELLAIEALAATGRNVAPGGVYDGTWTGNGVTSSAAATADDSANAGYEQNILAVEQNSDMYLGGYSSWTVGSATEKLGANDIIVKYTYNGDLNLDGAVDGNAATIFSTFYDNGATSGNIYAYGDLNGDGKIDGNDATIFSTVYGNGLAASGLPQL